MSSRHSLRAALVTAAAMGALAVTTACSAPPESTGQSSEAIVLPIHNPIPVPVFHPQPIWTETGAPESNNMPWTCGSYDVPVPTSLAGLGCTLGVAVQSNNCDGTLYQGWVWACLPEAYRVAIDNQQWGTFGGQLPPFTGVVGYAPVPFNVCYGNVDSGYVLISESNEAYLGCSPAACQGSECGKGGSTQ